MSFNADFTIDNEGIFANEKILLKNNSTTGLVIDSTFLQIDGDVDKNELDLSNYIINNISKVQWSFSDGVFYSTDTVVHTFKESKKETVKLTIWSDAFVYQGKTFYFTHSVTKDINVQSRFYKFIKNNYPLYDEIASPELEDLIKSAGKFFDRLHEDTSGLLKLIDINRISPEYLEYWALTLGHTEYVKKVGYELADNNFDDYDIFDKIKLNIATQEEINTLRNFILFSAELFRNKGTSKNITNFLKFFSIDGKVKDLWTKTWSVLLKESIEETFNGYDSFEDNKLKLNWQNINISNINNSECYFEKKFNSIILNSYNVIEKLEYPLNEVSTVSVSGDKFGWKEFELSNNYGLSASPSVVLALRKENGDRLIRENTNDVSEFYDIVPNDPVRFDSEKYSVLQVSDTVLTEGDRLSVLYDFPSNTKKTCVVATTQEKVKDFDIRVSFKLNQENKRTNLFRTPDNEVFVIFRGIKNKFDFNSSFDDFYKFSLNTDRKTFSLSKIIFSDGINDYLTQHISFSFNNDEVFEPVIFYPSVSTTPDELFEFKKEKEYELLMMVNGSKLSVYIREKENENQIKENIGNFEGDANIHGQQEIDWIPLIENFSFDVSPKKVKTVDNLGNEIYSEKYTITNESGYYGLGVGDGIVEFTKVILNNLDVDDKLYNQVEKELELKPKYLENLEYYETRSDNYKDTQKTFIKNLSDEFKVNSAYELTKEESASLNSLFIDKAPVSQKIGTRYLVEFNNDWINQNFESNEDVVSKIVIPFGSQKGWVLPEQRILDNSNYEITGSPNFMAIASGSPGFFSADLTTILDGYQTEPFDNFSSLSRENIDSLTLTFNDRLNQYINYNSNNFELNGVWEEVYPLSNYFESIDPTKILDDSSEHTNKMFAPITVDIPEGLRVIGVKFKDCDYIKNLITRYSTEFNKEVTMWGSFTFHVPCGTLIKKPSNYTLQDSSKFPGHYQITVFVPLGILNEAVLNYSLSREFTQQSNNSPSLIELNGLFAKLVPEKLILGNGSITLKTANPFESVEKGLKVNHFISAGMKLSTSLQIPKVLEENTLNNIFTLDENNRNFFDSLVNEDDFRWWLPSEVWRIRDFELQQVNLEDDIVSGINYISKDIEEDNTSKIFYGKEVSTQEDNIRSLNIKLTDGSITPNTLYYAKVKVKIKYSGFNTSNLDSLSESDKNNVKIGGSKYTKDLQLAPVNVCKEIYLPISWYDTNELLKDNPNYDKCSTNPSLSAQVILSDTLEFGNYLRKSYIGSETVTLSPIGLMSEAINFKPISNINILLNITDVANYVAESVWDYNNWNKYFIENLEIVEIYEKIPDQYYTLFNKYIIFADSKINTGSNLEFVYNTSDVEWGVLKNFSYFITNYINKDLTFDVPFELKDIYEWNKNISDVYLNRYVVDKSLYTIGDDKVTITSDSFLEKLQGGKLNGLFNFDLYFDKERKYKTVEDDFNTTRQINWIPYESNSSEIFENMKRIPSNKLLLGLPASNTDSHDIIVKDNIYAFRSLNKNSIYPFEGRQSGTRVNNRNVNIAQNEPNARRIFMIDNDNFIFDIKADVYFDAKLNDIKNYRGKKFEIILKAEETFEPILGKNILGNYYFAGIGSYDFDVAMGVSSFNKDTLKNESSFLAGFGDYNTRNIKSNVWYTLRCIVTNDYIRVLFNPKDEPERLVMNYFINEKYQQDTSRYLSGNFEELVYNITGLDKLNIIYPDKAGENTNDKFVRRFINNELIPKVRPTGSLCGFRIYNEYTYMTNISYKYLSEDGYKVGNAFETNNLSDMIIDINKKY